MASLAPLLEHDIFISYTHIDNQPFGEDQARWVTQLHELLSIRVAQLLGRSVSIWRDGKLSGNDSFPDELLTRLDTVALLVSVFSPRYFNSEWCRRELRTFLEAAQRSGGVRLGNKLRVFKLLRTPVPRDRIPPDLQWLLDEALGYEFYRQLESGRIRDFLLDPDLHREYWLRLDDLAQDIAETLLTFTQQQGGQPESEGKGTVYLAETTSDMHSARDGIRRELALRGYHVVPEVPLPLRASDLQQAVQTWVGKAKLAVYPIGSVYGLIPEGAQESLVALQLQAAAAPSGHSNCARLVWLPRGLEPAEPRQQQFIEAIRVSPSAGTGLEMFVGTIEELKTYVVDLLDKQVAPVKQPTTLLGVQVYLVCEARDFEKTKPVRDALRERGYTVTWPLFEGSDADIREEHQAALTECDAVIIYYGGISEAWLRQKVRELAKALGWGRTAPFRSRAVYVAGDLPAARRELPVGPPLIDLLIEGSEPFSLAPLQTFFSAVQQGKGARA